ncbi:ATPase domain-containing protein [Caballeronia sp. LZ065]|uniref:ATPase domain-containing protein n=1 Tax=Caballeronia sp. LZ065 TaxID=3038571 RepID=UPI002864BEF4|nr:ATPase domain-containing protein [Caballeronia sp. LZ065]MDR5781621.1 ATPase domain-containing protein [Caballeronia sp. LZ065]
MTDPKPPRISTGLTELDDILNGGWPASRLYLVEGRPGSGKTTLGLQFLRDGVAAGETVLFITLSETSSELDEVAAAHGWSMDGITVFEMEEAELKLGIDGDQSLLHSWEIELGEVIRHITEHVERVKPSRIVFDSLSELRLLAQDPLRFRRQLLSLKHFFNSNAATVLLMDDMSARGMHDVDLHSLCHGVVTLERLTLDFGVARRRLQVQKLRGSAFREGFHDFAIREGGLQIFPRLVALEHHTEFVGDVLPSGSAALDALLGGGPLRGTSTLITGPAGTGKTTMSLQYAAQACSRGERCIIYEFDERIGTLLVRSRGVGIDLQPHIDSGLLHIRQIDPSEISPGEFNSLVRSEVTRNDARLIIIDSLNGYLAAMPQEQQLILQLHELLSFLNQQGVATFLINPQQGLIGNMHGGSLNISYIADAVILLRFFEAEGRVRKALSVLKNRGNLHESTIRELIISARGLELSEPLTRFNGVLSGTPTYTGGAAALGRQRDSNPPGGENGAPRE